MTAKEYLNQARTLDRHINYKWEQVQQLRELAGKATSSFTAERVSGTPQRSKMANCVERIVDLEQEIRADIEKLMDLKRNIGKLIGTLEREEQRIILELRYLNGYSWERVAVESDYTYRQVHRIHGKALFEASKKMS